MRRSDRLFELIQLFRDGRVWRGQDLADRMEVSLRTIYRDIDTLIASGVPIEGARGVGYMLRAPIFLPPLTLTAAELEALYLGVAAVERTRDPAMIPAARSLKSKIDAVVRDARRAEAAMPVVSMLGPAPEEDQVHLPLLRAAVRDRMRIDIQYRRLDSVLTDRTVRPLNLQYWGATWTLVAWCEARSDFRVFRVDRIEATRACGDSFTHQPGQTYADFLVTQGHA